VAAERQWVVAAAAQNMDSMVLPTTASKNAKTLQME
jgi:hypothetical protein